MATTSGISPSRAAPTPPGMPLCSIPGCGSPRPSSSGVGPAAAGSPSAPAPAPWRHPPLSRSPDPLEVRPSGWPSASAAPRDFLDTPRRAARALTTGCKIPCSRMESAESSRQRVRLKGLSRLVLIGLNIRKRARCHQGCCSPPSHYPGTGRPGPSPVPLFLCRQGSSSLYHNFLKPVGAAGLCKGIVSTAFMQGRFLCSCKRKQKAEQRRGTGLSPFANPATLAVLDTDLAFFSVANYPY